MAERFRPDPSLAAKPKPDVAKVMLYLPRGVKRKFDEMAFHADRKAHGFYLEAIEAYLRNKRYAKEADLLKSRMKSKDQLGDHH